MWSRSRCGQRAYTGFKRSRHCAPRNTEAAFHTRETAGVMPAGPTVHHHDQGTPERPACHIDHLQTELRCHFNPVVANPAMR